MAETPHEHVAAPKRATAAVGTVIEEAYVLALEGRRQAALRLIDDALDRLDSGPGAAERERLVLARLRILPGRISPGARREAKECLERLATDERSFRWRSYLQLARDSRKQGDEQLAAQHLQSAIAAFKSDPLESEALGPTLATMLSEEVGLITSPSKDADHADRPIEVRLKALLEFSRKLVTETDPDRVLRVALQDACSLTGADRGLVVLVRGDDLELAAAENMDQDPLLEPSLEISRTVIREVIQTKTSHAFTCADHAADHPARRSLSAMGVHHVLCVPILTADTLLGVLYLDWRTSDQSALRDHEELGELFAVQAAAALQNATRHHETERALEKAEETVRRERKKHEQRDQYGDIIGASAAMQEVYDQLDLMVLSDEPLILLGETGTGKDLVAHLLHSRGPRSDKEFVAINCASLSETLLESELFGYERGAFTGADRSRPGLVELADGGTLFLDEVGDMSPRMQAELLRVLQSGELRRVGGRRTIRVSVRIVAATHRDLEQRVADGEFREDLFYRLNVLKLRLPPLRERTEDIPPLTEAILRKLAADSAPPPVSEQAMAKLMAYPWPGNVRELENTLRGLVALRCSTIEKRHLPDRLLRPELFPVRAGTLKEAEAQAIRRALEVTRGNKLQAARLLGIDRGTLYSKLKTID